MFKLLKTPRHRSKESVPWENFNSAVELILGGTDSMWMHWRFKNCHPHIFCGGRAPLLHGSTHWNTQKIWQLSVGEESWFLLYKLAFYRTWPTRFHTWFLLNSRNRFFPLNQSKSIGSVDWQKTEPVFVNVQGAQESIPPGWASISGLLKRFTNSGSVHNNVLGGGGGQVWEGWGGACFRTLR